MVRFVKKRTYRKKSMGRKRSIVKRASRSYSKKTYRKTRKAFMGNKQKSFTHSILIQSHVAPVGPDQQDKVMAILKANVIDQNLETAYNVMKGLLLKSDKYLGLQITPLIIDMGVQSPLGFYGNIIGTLRQKHTITVKSLGQNDIDGTPPIFNFKGISIKVLAEPDSFKQFLPMVGIQKAELSGTDIVVFTSKKIYIKCDRHMDQSCGKIVGIWPQNLIIGNAQQVKIKIYYTVLKKSKYMTWDDNKAYVGNFYGQGNLLVQKPPRQV